MINSHNGDVLLQGSLPDILSDFTVVIKRIYDMLTDECHMSDEMARKTIAKCGRMAFTPDDILHETIDKVRGVVKGRGGEEQLREALKDFAAWAGTELTEISPEAFADFIEDAEIIEDMEDEK